MTPRCAPPGALPWLGHWSPVRPAGAVGALAVGGPSTVLRVRRLSGRGNSAVLSAAAYLAAAAVLVVPTVALAVPWLTQLQRLFIA